MTEDKDDSELTIVSQGMSPAKYCLRGVSGPTFGKIFVLQGKMTVGRGKDCDLIINDPQISRHHAEIDVKATVINVRDLGSANGTFINNNPISTAPLGPGDEISFEKIRFRVEERGKLATAPRPEEQPSHETNLDTTVVVNSNRNVIILAALMVIAIASIIVAYFLS